MAVPDSDALTVATKFVESQYPDCAVAFLAGSVARGQQEAHSDLDLVVISTREAPHWATYREDGWPIEVFMQTPDSYRAAFAHWVKRRWPLLLTLCADGLVIQDRDGSAAEIGALARKLLAAGPEPVSAEKLEEYRYTLTWMIDDLIDATDVRESEVMAFELSTTMIDCFLTLDRRWLGQGKWRLRLLREADSQRAEEVEHAVVCMNRDGDRVPLVRLASEILQLAGGPHFEGQYQAD
ncbi:MAG: nucleotidyltransferase domain-containing protein [Chloroflexota bacterium]